MQRSARRVCRSDAPGDPDRQEGRDHQHLAQATRLSASISIRRAGGRWEAPRAAADAGQPHRSLAFTAPSSVSSRSPSPI